VVAGVTCVVVHDVVLENGSPVEDTYDWYAQDAEGNVWYFGEDTKDLENGRVTTTKGSWEAGVDGAQPGIVMQADPRRGDPYRQEYLKGEAEDMGQVVRLNASVSVPSGTYEGVVVTREFTPLEPGIVEEKYFAPNVGFVYGRTVRGGSEVTSLVSVTTA
jgi:hypothetical protein